VNYNEATAAIAAEMFDGARGLFPSTPAPDKPIPLPEAHRARIDGVTAETSPNTGTQYLKFSYTSLDTGIQDTLSVFPPTAYVIDPGVDGSTLSDERPVKEDGTLGMSERAKYARNVRNTKGDGTIQLISQFAIEQGRVWQGGTAKTFDELAAGLNQLTSGVEVVAFRKADTGGDPQYADRLRTTRFANINTASNPKYYKPPVKRMWEV